MLGRDELTRYSRHIFLPQIGKEGQIKLKKSKVLVVGAGGLGSPVLLYLAAAGIGRITIIEDDNVELVNLQRQILYSTDDIGKSKVTQAARVLQKLNPHIEIQPIPLRLNALNAIGLLSANDLVIETSDNFPTKFLVNDVCILKNIPLLMGAILQFVGQVQWILPHKTACYRCIFQQLPPADAVPNCSQAGVFGAVAGMIGSFQAALAIRYLCGLPVMPSGLTEFNLLESPLQRTITIQPKQNCSICSTNPSIHKIDSKNYEFAEN